MAFKWTKEADDFIRTYYPTHDTKELADELGVSKTAVASRAFRLKIKKECYAREVPEGFFVCYSCKDLYQTPSGKRGNGYCKECNRKRQREKKQEKLIEKSKQEQGVFELEKLIQETAEVIYTCNACGQEKLGKDFKFDKRRKKRESMCYACRSERNKKSKLKMIKEGRGW